MKLKNLFGINNQTTFVFVADVSNTLKSTCPVYRTIPNEQSFNDRLLFFNVFSGSHVENNKEDGIMEQEIKLLVI